jgi:hypothetical protein
MYLDLDCHKCHVCTLHRARRITRVLQEILYIHTIARGGTKVMVTGVDVGKDRRCVKTKVDTCGKLMDAVK